MRLKPRLPAGGPCSGDGTKAGRQLTIDNRRRATPDGKLSCAIEIVLISTFLGAIAAATRGGTVRSQVKSTDPKINTFDGKLQ